MEKKIEEKKKGKASVSKTTKETVKKIVKKEVIPKEVSKEKVEEVIKEDKIEVQTDNNKKGNKKIIIALVCVLCLGLGIGGGILIDKQLNKDKKATPEKEIVKEIEEKIEKVYSCEFDKDDAIVSFDNIDMISNLELYNKLKSDYALQSLINIIDKRILEEKYPDELDNAKEQAKETMKQLENAYGDELEQAIQYYTGYQTADAYQDYLYIEYLQNLVVDEFAKKQINEKSIKDYYDKEIVGDIKVRHILITPVTTSAMTDAEIKAAKDEAKEKAEAIITELKKTDKDKIESKFIELAKEQSSDKATKDNGGSLGFINKDTLSEYYENIVDAAYKLKDGEFSTSVVETTMGYHVVLRTESKEKASLEDAKEQIVEKLVNNYITSNGAAIINAMDNIRKEAGMKFNDKELEKKYNTYIKDLIKTYSEQEQ